MRYTSIFAVLSLTFSGAMAADTFRPGFGPFGPFGPWDGDFDFPFDFNIDFPHNPCEWVGGSCDPVTGGITGGFCSGSKDVILTGLACGPKGTVGVGCCWHPDATNTWIAEWKKAFEEWKAAFEKL